jgi:UDP:flavonoid glycosyltransferase YjiC (YdhE family)
MKFVLAVHGTRGDVEPGAAIGVELLRRGHDVQMAVAPNMVGFVESAGLEAVAYGPDSSEQLQAASGFIDNALKIQHPRNIVHAAREIYGGGWAEMGRTLTSLAEGANLVFTGQTYQGVAANVAEHHGIPLVGLNYFPTRVNGQVGLPSVPSSPPLVRSTIRIGLRLYSWLTKEADHAQRRELGLPKTARSAGQRMLKQGCLEIQAYDELCFPGLAEEWAGLPRPFVGGLTMDLTSGDEEVVASWIAAGTPPIYFSFGSTPVQSASDTVAMIGATCTELGERALIYSATSDYSRFPVPDHVRLVGPLNYSTIFPTCRAVVHHGGAGTTAAVLRAGVPSVVLWDVADQPIWAAQVKRLKVGSARRLSSICQKSLVAELRAILKPEYSTRARDFAVKMSRPADAAAAAAELLEKAARDGDAQIDPPGNSIAGSNLDGEPPFSI